VPVQAEAFTLAESFAQREELSLRADDALHLAIACQGSHSVASLDQAMISAARALSITVAFAY
jgi:predicted nucleic acid-binding protein